MNRLWSICAALCVSSVLAAQTYTFESNYTNWSAQQGTLSLTEEHYKEGTKSLQWTTTGRSVLLITGFNQYAAGNNNSCFMQVYLPEATGDTLVVEFLNGTVARRTATFVCNYRGWREFNRAYSAYASSANSPITAVRMTLYPADATAERYICFDDVALNATTDKNHIPGTQWVADAAYIATNNTPLLLYANPVDLPVGTPTEEELRDLETVRARVATELTYNAPQAAVAKNWVTNNIEVVRNADGTVHGTIINTSASALTTDEVKTIADRLQKLAGGKLNGNTTIGQAFDDYLDLLIDQGLGAGTNIAYQSNSYTAPREVIPMLVSILPACNDTQKKEMIGLIKWLAYYGVCYYPEDAYLSNQSSDIVYLFLPYMYKAVVENPDAAEAVRDLHAVQRWMNRSMDYVPGEMDFMKIDGTGFHHKSHYNNYMYAYQTYNEGVYALRGTAYQISETAYAHFAKAILAVYTMATSGKADNRFYANALAGRNPFAAGNNLAFNKSAFTKLIEAGEAYPETQAELKSAYNYFYQTAEYTDVPEVSYDGVHQFNYSPIAVVRQGNWVATMRAPTSKFWGAEIYSKENRFGRYQSHGSLEVLYDGANLGASGYPTNKTGGGWDWNVVPGTTTVHYTSWTDMMPKQNQTQRFDQYSGGTNFAGALANGNVGVFAANLSQTDVWGSQCFTPTNLKAHKSVFIFDSILVAVGTGIESSGSYGEDRITATNLFQSIISNQMGELVVDGEAVSEAYDTTLPRGSHWLLAPTGTGYWLPETEDKVRVIYGQQTTPQETGADHEAPKTTATAAKAYIDHGSHCSDKEYVFAVVPGTTAGEMAQWAARLEAGTVYRLYQQDATLHAVGKDQTIAYAFYGATENISYGIVRAATHQHLLTVTYHPESQSYTFAVCNPNLEPQQDATYGWVATATETTLTIEGDWETAHGVAGVTTAAPTAGQTEVTIRMEEGLPIYFELVPYGTDVQEPQAADCQIVRHGERIDVSWERQDVGSIALYTVGGQLVAQQAVAKGVRQQSVDIRSLPAGVYVCRAGNEQLKFVK